MTPLKTLPESPNLDHLKKQAKDLLREAVAGETPALLRFVETLPVARGLKPADLANRALQLHDAQSVVAREYGFASFAELTRYLEWKQGDRAQRLKQWATWVYVDQARERRLALRMLRDEPELFSPAAQLREPWIACAVGNAETLSQALTSAQERGPLNLAQPIGPLATPLLVAVTFSQLAIEPGFEKGMADCLALLLDHGADPDTEWKSPAWEQNALSVLYGAVGRARSLRMTKLLLEAGANPNDNESLYHSCEAADPEITRALLKAGATVPGSNALGRILDFDKLDLLRDLLAHGGDANEKPWIHFAISRGRSTAHVKLLVGAGADLHAVDAAGMSLFRYAQLNGRQDVIAMLREAGITGDLSGDLSLAESFVAAAASGDEPAARAILSREPGIFARLTPHQLQTLPQLAAAGQLAGVKTMLALGWPREEKAGWGATALNLAVFRGDAAMAELLLASGANWRTLHGYNGNVIGTLSWSSSNNAHGSDCAIVGDFAGCARALLASGVPLEAFAEGTFSPEVEEVIDQARLESARQLSD